MPNIKYVGPYDRQSYTAADLKRVGVEDGKAVSWGPGEVKEVDDATAEFLLTMPDHFAEADDEDEGAPVNKPNAAPAPDANVEGTGEGATPQTGVDTATDTGTSTTRSTPKKTGRAR